MDPIFGVKGELAEEELEGSGGYSNELEVAFWMIPSEGAFTSSLLRPLYILDTSNKAIE